MHAFCRLLGRANSREWVFITTGDSYLNGSYRKLARNPA